MNNFFTRILDKLKIKTKLYYTYLGSTIYGEAANMPTNRDYLDSYEVSFLVNACVRKISEKVANTEFKLYQINEKEIDEKTDHPLLDLLAQVNPFTTKFEMLDLTQTYLELLGNAYWLKVRGESSDKILELWMLRPDRVRIIEDPEKIVGGYEYTLPNGIKQTFAPENIIHFKQPNPKSYLYGLPTVKSIMEVIQNSIYAIRWNKNFFYHQARPDGILMLKTKQTPEQKKEFKKQWQSEFGGVSKAHKTMVTEGEVDYKVVTATIKDMDFVALRESTMQDILLAFGVPKAIVGAQGMNRAEAESQIYVFLSETIEPKIRRIIERLNEFLVPEFGDNLHLDFDDPTPEDEERRARIDDIKLKNNTLLINEVRDEEGLPPLEGGWDFYLPFSMMPVGGAEEEKNYIKIKGLNPKEYKIHKKEKEQSILRTKILAGKRKLKLEMQLSEELRKLFIRKQKIFTKEQKKAFWMEHDKILTSDKKLFRIMMKGLFRNQRERFQDALRTQFTGKKFDLIVKSKYDIINWEIEKDIFISISEPVFTDIIMKRGRIASDLIGAEEFQLTDRIKKFIDKKIFKFANEVNDTTRDLLKGALKEGVDAGEGVSELSKRISDIFKDREGYGAERIARTEVLSASNEANHESYIQSEVVEKKEWLATLDDRVREKHAGMNGEVVGIDEKFSNGLLFPGDPKGDAEDVINCRCALLPVIEI